ncbi:MAG: LysM peptidoglycan-binding domain-containing protein [Spirochaetaceae bacterium]|jgi:membrane-bound lytic murein transglycosylase D|nr:LysM peptidoglycan-binding domain-containing protein [Spirochaetaceae bacterium]GMO29257.1 MAG: LysM peptidoglycan-binding domain-containing protein [Termitinemataceae bacterium]
MKIFFCITLFIFAFVQITATEQTLPAEHNLQEPETPKKNSGIERPLRSIPVQLPARLKNERESRDFSETLPSIQGFDHPLTQNWIARYSTRAHLIWLASVLRNSEPYLDFVRAEVERRELPPELVYLPVIESGFTVTARSRSGALGLWQFMRNSMSPYMKLDDWHDERLDFWIATNSALSKLQAHYKQFGNWPIALAAYNAGGGAINRIIKETGSNDYWYFAETKKLKTESINYVPKLLAVYYIISNPRKFGLDICRPQERFEWTRIAVQKQVNIALLAENSGIETYRLRDANRELFTLVTPPTEYFLKVRAEDAPAVQAVLDNNEIQLLKHHIHTIKNGDTLYAISKQYGVSVKQILDENTSIRAEALKPGTQISIPMFKGAPSTIQPAQNKSPPKAAGNTRQKSPEAWTGTYTVVKGDTLWSIAKQFSVNIEDLARVNNIGLKSVLGIGKKLFVP